MIITDLSVEDFRKYERLHLENIPKKGLIVVSGNNESGKSSVGDAICFALFGRTEQLSGLQIGKLVRWGQDIVRVTLSFRHQDKQYRLTRRSDRSGQQTASLWSVDEGRTLADSTREVAAVVNDILGYDYAIFLRTFYWSQQVSEEGNADTESLQAMAGIKTYIKLDETLREEYKHDAKQLNELESGLKASAAARNAMDIDQDLLPQLLDVRETLEGRRDGSVALTQNIATVRENYTEQHGLFHRVNGWSRKVGWLATLGIILLILVLLAWAVFTFVPQWLSGLSLTETASGITGRTLLWAGVVLSVLTSLLMLYGWHLERNRLRPLREDSVVWSGAIQDGSDQLNSNMGHYIGGQAERYLVGRALLDKNKSHEGWERDPERLQSLADDIRVYQADPLETIAAADGVSLALERQNEEITDYLTVINEDIDSERENVEQYMVLNAEVKDNQQQIGDRQQQIQVKKKGLELLNKASLHAISNFNRIVHDRCGELLSGFTQDSYKNLEIDPGFAMRVLSEEKGDYLEFEEISAGTQRQIALAMRVALANTLAESSAAGGQFLFLDEPFAFFDPERTESTVGSLTETTEGQHLTQVWLTVQHVPDSLQGAFIVDCQQGRSVLEVSG